jgi:TatA/E family protein of Tat protein translocase
MGPLEILIVILIIALVLGRNRLPELGRNLGRGLGELRDAVRREPKPPPPEIERGEAPGEPGAPTDADSVDDGRV